MEQRIEKLEESTLKQMARMNEMEARVLDLEILPPMSQIVRIKTRNNPILIGLVIVLIITNVILITVK